MLTVQGLKISIQKATILRGVDIQVSDGAMVGLIGRNGAGKTTLMRAIMGLIPHEDGVIKLGSTDLLSCASYKRAVLGIGYLPEGRQLISRFTVEENLLVPLWATRRTGEQHRLEWVYDLVPEIARLKTSEARTLSGGQQKFVALGRALICGSKLLLLDEPFEGIAPALTRRLIEVLANLKGKGLSVLISDSSDTHSAKLFDKVLFIERGQITGSPNN